MGTDIGKYSGLSMTNMGEMPESDVNERDRREEKHQIVTKGQTAVVRRVGHCED